MAVLQNMPSERIISSLEGILDFYFWKGLPVVRAWPKAPEPTEAIKRTWENARDAGKLWRKTNIWDKDAFWRVAGTLKSSCYDIFRSTAQRDLETRKATKLIDVEKSGQDLTIFFRNLVGDHGGLVYFLFPDISNRPFVRKYDQLHRKEGWTFQMIEKGFVKGMKTEAGVGAGDKSKYIITTEGQGFIGFIVDNQYTETRFATGLYILDINNLSLKDYNYEYSKSFS